MKEDKDKKERGEVSRRDFLVGAGAVVVGGAIGAGITYPLVSGGEGEVTTVKSTETVSTTVTTTAGAETVTTTKTVGGDGVVTVTEPGGTVTTTKTVSGDGVVEPWQEPEESHYFQVTFH